MSEAEARAPNVPRTDWQNAVWELREAEKEHMRRGDALAARRRRLPMTQMPEFRLTGRDGDVGLRDVFEGRRQLITYQLMWRDGSPAQCEGCTMFMEHFASMQYLNARDTTFAIVTRGPWAEASAYRARMGWTMPWYSSPELAGYLLEPETSFTLTAFLTDGEDVFQTYATTGRGTETHSYHWSLLDLTAYGRQEAWEDSPAGWPQTSPYEWWTVDGVPIAAQQRSGGSCCRADAR